MPQPNIIRPVKLTTNLPEDIMARLKLHLWSEVEGRIPKGAYSRFICDRVREYLDPGQRAGQARLCELLSRLEDYIKPAPPGAMLHYEALVDELRTQHVIS